MIVKQASTAVVPNGNVSVVKRVINDARAMAESLVEEAQTEAVRIRAELEQELETARQQGFREGWQHALEKWDSYLVAALEHREQVILRAEAEVLRLSVKIAEKIIGRELKTDPSTVADITRTALQQAPQTEMITVRANPTDVPTLEAFRAHFARSGRIKYVDIVADQHIEAGGCRIETAVGTVDAQINVQLRALGNALLAQLDEQRK